MRQPGAAVPPLQGSDEDVPVRHRAVVALEQDGPRSVGAIEARSRTPLAEVSDVAAILFSQSYAQAFRLVRILLVEPLEGLAVGLAVADVVIPVDGLAVPDQRQVLP